MRANRIALAIFVALSEATAWGHGPQIQITNDGDKIVTRRLIADAPYSGSLTSATSVYVMPLLPTSGVWYSQPNSALDPILGVPSYFSGPGLTYGYDLADGGPQAFAAGSVLSLEFTAGLKRWNGSSFTDAGATELKAFRGSNVNITSPPQNFAITSDAGPFDSLSLAAVAANYGSEGAEVHGTINFALLGDGSSPTSSSGAETDGIYLLNLRLSSTQAGLAASDEYFFVLSKNAAPSELTDAVSSLGFAPPLVEWTNVPEPCGCALAVFGAAIVAAKRLAARRRGGR
jgi:hypothetical protein